MQKAPPLTFRVRLKPHGQEVGPFSWLRRLDGLALFAFICGSSFLHGQGQLRFLAIVMILSFLIVHFCRPNPVIPTLRPLPSELIFYTVWIGWTGITGVLVAIEQHAFVNSYFVAVQMLVMVWCIYAILRNLKTVEPVYWALIAGGVIQIIAVAGGMADFKSMDAQRAMGLTQNPNFLGFLMIWCLLCALLFWHHAGKGRTLRRGLIILVVALALYVLLASGSRKSALVAGFLITGWAGYAVVVQKGYVSYLKRILIIAVLVFTFIQVIPIIIAGTPVGQRFEAFVQMGSGDLSASAQKNIRYRMYVEGIQLFMEHPVFGVGLDNFRHYFFSGQYSHSDYIEPLVTTGLIGFILYQAFYLCLISRSLKLLRAAGDPVKQYRLKMILIGVICIMLLGLGAPHYNNQSVFILLTAFATETCLIGRQIKHRDGVLYRIRKIDNPDFQAMRPPAGLSAR